MSEKLKLYIGIMTANVIKLITFAWLAIHFNKWWIIFFTAIFWTSSKNEEKSQEEDSNGV